VSDTRQAATLRIAIFGAAPTPAWLEATARSAPAGLTLALFGRCASVADPESNDRRQ